MKAKESTGTITAGLHGRLSLDYGTSLKLGLTQAPSSSLSLSQFQMPRQSLPLSKLGAGTIPDSILGTSEQGHSKTIPVEERRKRQLSSIGGWETRGNLREQDEIKMSSFSVRRLPANNNGIMILIICIISSIIII